MSSSNSDPRRRRRRSSLPSPGTLVTAAAVAYGSYRVVSWAWNAWNERNEDEEQQQDNYSPPAEHSRQTQFVSTSPGGQQQQQHYQWRLRRARLERCRDETATALKDFLPTLKRSIELATDTSEATKKLKTLRAQKQQQQQQQANSNDSSNMILSTDYEQERDLWDTIKIKSITRIVATCYAHTILFLVLTVQVNLLGGRLFDEQMRNHQHPSGGGAGGDRQSSMGSACFGSQADTTSNSVASDRMTSYQESHRIVLTKTYDYFFQRGIASLVQTVERAVEDVMQDWIVTDPSSMHTSREMMEEAISSIRDVVEGGGRTTGSSRRPRSRSRRPRSMIRFLLPPEGAGLMDAPVPDELAQTILDETWDLMESPVLDDAQRDCLNVTFDLMRDEEWGTQFANSDAPQHASSRWTTRPLASVITQLKYTFNSFYRAPESTPLMMDRRLRPASAVNVYVTAMERLPSVLELGDVSFD